MCLVIILAFTDTFLKAGPSRESLKVQWALHRTQSCHSFSNPLYFFVLKREILFSYPWELHLFPIILWDGYLFAKYKSDVLGDKCTKDPSWWFEVNSLLCSLLPPYAIKLSHCSHKYHWNYTVEENNTFSALWENPVGYFQWHRKAQLNALHCIFFTTEVT